MISISYTVSGKVLCGFELESTVWAIQNNKAYDLKYLLAIINSRLGEYRFNQNGKKRGVGVDIGVLVFRQFPVKVASKEQQQNFIDTVDKILTIKKNDPKTDTSKLEKEIDQMVYKLYELTDEEVKVVEESVGK